MTIRPSHLTVIAACGLLLTGCRLADQPPWSRMQPTAQNPYGDQLAAGQTAPGQDPFVRQSPHYAGRINGGGVGRVTIPSAGHPVPNGAYGNGQVMQAGYQTPAQPTGMNPAPHMMPPRTPPNYQPPRQFTPQPGIKAMPMPANGWQQHQPTTAGQVASPFAPVQAH